MNYPEIYKMLDAVGYKGWVAAEYHPRGKTEDGLAWLRAEGVQPRGGRNTEVAMAESHGISPELSEPSSRTIARD